MYLAACLGQIGVVAADSPQIASDYLPGYERQEIETNAHHKLHTHEDHKQLAASRYRQAADLIQHNDSIPKESLPLLRSSCRLDPLNASYWNDLGVATLRLGQVGVGSKMLD